MEEGFPENPDNIIVYNIDVVHVWFGLVGVRRVTCW